MSPLTPDEVSALLATAGRGSTVFLVGAGGCGMSGLGHLLLDLGHRVAGSDLVVNDAVRQLRARGALIHEGHAAEQLAAARPALAIYSSAVRRDNPELRQAEALRVPIVRRGVALAALVNRQRGLCVAGMHGKTTTSALLAYALEQLGAAPGYAIGGAVPQLERHARLAPTDGDQPLPARPWFVVEADESDGTLREFRPEFALVLNVDEEHVDFYANLDAVCAEFGRFAANTRGRVIFCADDLRLAELFNRSPGAVAYGFHPLATYRLVKGEVRGEEREGFSVRPSHLPPLTSFEVWHAGVRLGDFTTRLLGGQNVSNAGAVVALLHQLGYTATDIARTLAGFTGVARRQQELFADARFRVFDDYGHHPAEIAATLRAFKTLRPRRLLVAFQPHRYTRTQALRRHFATCFQGADLLWLTEIYAASEPEIPGVSGARLAEAVRATGQAAAFVPTLAELRRAVRAAMEPGDLVLFLGAGDITRAAQELAAELKQDIVMPKETLLAQLTAALSADSLVRRDEPLARRTTLRVGGPADFYVEPASEADLARLLQFCREHALPFTVIGRGSNLLVRDGGIRGVVLCLAHPNFNRLEITGERLRAGAGVKLKTLAVEARRHGLAGLEFLEGIPGSVGGALRMNAGAMGSWVFEVVESIRFMDHAGQAHERRASEVYVEYRGCPLFKDHIALGAVLKGVPASPETIAERMNAFSARRWETQPAAASAGCIFKNPPSIPAGRLIDELGLKGTRVGGAVVSDVHGNFIVNEGAATAQDVLNLIEIVRQRAKAARGIELETEVEILGEG
jgi:UDP-N-acetylmuramate--L-alanine ligase/UDP-N-acetylenolpyruvoylglucosamine reductase